MKVSLQSNYNKWVT